MISWYCHLFIHFSSFFLHKKTFFLRYRSTEKQVWLFVDSPWACWKNQIQKMQQSRLHDAQSAREDSGRTWQSWVVYVYVYEWSRKLQVKSTCTHKALKSIFTYRTICLRIVGELKSRLHQQFVVTPHQSTKAWCGWVKTCMLS